MPKKDEFIEKAFEVSRCVMLTQELSLIPI